MVSFSRDTLEGRGITRRELLRAGVAGAALGSLPACALGPWGQTSAGARLDALFERSFARRLARSPLLQASIGIKTDQDQWDTPGDAHAVEDAGLTRAELAELRRIDRAQLPPAAQLSHRLFEYDAEQELARFAWRHHHYPVCQMRGPQRTVPQTLIDKHPIASREDAQAYIARLQRVQPYLAAIVAGLRRQEAMGIKPPAFSYPLVIGTCENLLRGAPFDESDADSPIYADFKSKLAAAQLSSPEQLLRNAQAALRKSVAPGFHELIAWLREAHARGAHSSGVWTLPEGKAYYEAILQVETTLPVTPDEVHERGLTEVARIHGELAAMKSRVGFKSKLPDFFRYLQTDSRFYLPSTDEGRRTYLAQVETVLAGVNARLGEITTFKPKAELQVRRLQEWLEPSAATAGYFPAAADGSRPGIVYYNQLDMAKLPAYEQSALAYHEGVPGHHLQNAVSRELDDLPAFRRYGSYTAYSEGWALYAEQLPSELGLYRDDWQEIGRLSTDLMRAGRLVVDTGLHARRWTVEQAQAWLERNTLGTPAGHVVAVRRYVVTPGQATAYQMGKQKILELRAQAKARLGERYRLVDFNDVVLGSGPVPLPVLEDGVRTWLATGAT